MYEIFIGYIDYRLLSIDELELDGKTASTVHDLIRIIKSYINKKDDNMRTWDMICQLYTSCKQDITDKELEEEGCIELIDLPEFSIYIRKI
jgi:hypothetical protein